MLRRSYLHVVLENTQERLKDYYVYVPRFL